MVCIKIAIGSYRLLGEGIMTVPSDKELLKLIVEGQLKIDPFCDENIQPASIDLTLDEKIKELKNGLSVVTGEEIDSSNYLEKSTNNFELAPGQMVLGQIKETISIPKNYIACIHNRSSLARMGLSVALASFINPGYSGQLPIIIKNAGNFTIKLVSGLRVCQLVLHEVSPVPSVDYSEKKGGKYQNEKDKLISKLHLDHEFSEYFKKNNSRNVEKISEFIEKHAEKKANKFLADLSNELKVSLGIG